MAQGAIAGGVTGNKVQAYRGGSRGRHAWGELQGRTSTVEMDIHVRLVPKATSELLVQRAAMEVAIALRKMRPTSCHGQNADGQEAAARIPASSCHGTGRLMAHLHLSHSIGQRAHDREDRLVDAAGEKP